MCGLNYIRDLVWKVTVFLICSPTTFITIFRTAPHLCWDLPVPAQYTSSQKSFCYFFNSCGVESERNSALWRTATGWIMPSFFLSVWLGFEKAEALNSGPFPAFSGNYNRHGPFVNSSDLWTPLTYTRLDPKSSTLNGKTSGWLPFSLEHEYFMGLEHTCCLLLLFLHVIAHTYCLCKSFPINGPK